MKPNPLGGHSIYLTTLKKYPIAHENLTVTDIAGNSGISGHQGIKYFHRSTFGVFARKSIIFFIPRQEYLIFELTHDEVLRHVIAESL